MTGPDAFGRLLAYRNGGCEDCHAELELRDNGGRVYVLVVLHDDSCPVLAAYEGRRA